MRMLRVATVVLAPKAPSGRTKVMVTSAGVSSTFMIWMPVAELG